MNETDIPDEVVDALIQLGLHHEIHTSERRSFRACRRRWDWIFRQNYYPIMTAKPLEFGTAFHAGMETYYTPETWKWNREIVGSMAIARFVSECEEQRKKALATGQQLYFDDDIEADYNERVELGRGMFQYYFSKVAPVVDKGWTPVKVEVGFKVAVPHPDQAGYIWCACNICEKKFDKYLQDISPENRDNVLMTYVRNFGLPVVYAGRLDMLATDENGNYWIFDWKTARSIADRYEFLYLDDQVSSYVWALNRLGFPVRGFVYHEQRKGYPQAPKMNKQRRLGCIFSVAKNQDVDYDSYLAAIKELDTEAYEAGLYDEMLNYLQNEGVVYYDRHQIHKSEAELEEVEHNIGLEALDIIDPQLRIYPSAGRFGCTFCAFQTPCMEKNAQSDYQYALDTMYEKREHYYVREKASTESKGGE